MRVSVVSLLVRVVRTSRAPSLFSVPPYTLSSTLLSCGSGSPVIVASSTALRPSTTTPSKGIISPGRTRMMLPTAT